jgi:hypothetical protein
VSPYGRKPPAPDVPAGVVQVTPKPGGQYLVEMGRQTDRRSYTKRVLLSHAEAMQLLDLLGKELAQSS